MVSLIVEGKRIYDKFTKDEVTVYAAQASFFIVLSFFPFIMLLLTLIQFIPNISKSDLMTITVAIMPDMLDSFVVGIIDDLYTKSPATIVSITAITALWSASRGMLSIERSLNRVNEISRKRNYIVRRIICAGYTIVFIFACVGSLIFLVLGSSLQRLIDRLFPLIGEIISFIVSFRSVAAMAILGQTNGQGDFSLARRVAVQVLVLSISLSLLLVPAVMLLAVPLTQSVTPEIVRDARTYLMLSSLILPFTFATAQYMAIQNAAGRPEKPLVPRKAFCTRICASCASAHAPVTAPLEARARPPSR